ncbi:hypothetical protein [Curtanaerobium respiraculi]|uniref:hypothetical protein n=1 Tax=Curtanaerobium respiraculi TaxID=2949669 RepID=UPI0024B32F78|nr:hypothetical protein [Curtanaerobium respiraculi]
MQKYSSVSNTTSAHAVSGSSPNVDTSTASMPYDVQAFMMPVTISGGDILK